MACQCGDPLLVQVNGANGCIRTLSRGGVPLTFVHKDLARVVHEVVWSMGGIPIPSLVPCAYRERGLNRVIFHIRIEALAAVQG
jgi:hypothetical protein